ncbi:MAG: SAVED domain-containing protein [Armatimonadetes bacterium]|nr:SAVED domain-containing protein [Armatimonadota bacterium]
MAHIVAYSIGGPRRTPAQEKEYVNSYDNLMFLCPGCHKLVDDHPAEYPIPRLKALKKEHEDRIYRLTDVKPETTTRVLKLAGRIRGHVSTVSDEQIQLALDGTSFDPRETCNIDLNNLDDSIPGYWGVATHQISQDVNDFLTRAVHTKSLAPISIFAIARIPLLMHLGSSISSKVPVDVFNRHVVNEDWNRVITNTICEFGFRWLRNGDSANMVLLVSLSGAVQLTSLPDEIRDAPSVAEIYIANGDPSRTCLEHPSSIQAFRSVFLAGMQEIRGRTPQQFSIVPAVPIAAAIHMGRDLLPDADPPVRVYDSSGPTSYDYALTINND